MTDKTKVTVKEVKDVMYAVLSKNNKRVTRSDVDLLYNTLKDYYISAIYEGRSVPSYFGYIEPVVAAERPNNLPVGNMPPTIPAHVQLKLNTSRELRKALYSIPIVDGLAQYN